jgi:hypothetical protein
MRSQNVQEIEKKQKRQILEKKKKKYEIGIKLLLVYLPASCYTKISGLGLVQE